jgi:hypothetical protein
MLGDSRSVRMTTVSARDTDSVDDSPFAHVPMPGAGPSGLQEGPFTFDKMVASAGRASTRGLSGWRVRLLLVAAGVVAASVLLGLIFTFIR